MTFTPASEAERLVKSSDRVRDIGEVFTPAGTVAAMLDLIPPEMWLPHPSATFLEPSCGNGNFLVAILKRKLEAITDALQEGTLAAGGSDETVQLHALQALSSIYAVDISVDNVIGGTPGHEVGARDRLIAVFEEWWEAHFRARLNTRSQTLRSARWIIDRNVLIGNMLPRNAEGRLTGREDLPLIEYTWQPGTRTVTVSQTTFGSVVENSVAETTGVMSLFSDVTKLEVAWSGDPAALYTAPFDAPAIPRLIVRNGNGNR